jgi:hypothetical protein
LINAGGHGWSATSTWVALVVAVLVLLAFSMLEGHARHPLLRVELLRRRPTLAGCFLMLVATGLMEGGFFLGSFALQHAFGYSALGVGLAFLPVAVSIVAGAQVASCSMPAPWPSAVSRSPPPAISSSSAGPSRCRW